MDADAQAAFTRALEPSGFTGGFGAYQMFYGLGEYDSVTVICTGDDDLTSRQLHDLGGHVEKVGGDKDITVIVDGLDTDVAAPVAAMALGLQFRQI